MHDCRTVAEIGNNHQGDLKLAHQMVTEAARAGAWAVKAQRRHNDLLYTRAYLRRPYESENSFGRTYGEHRAALELPLEVHRDLKSHAHDLGIRYGCTAFDDASLDDLNSIDVDFIKIASGDLTNLPLIQRAGQTGLPLVISTGGGSWQDVTDAVAAAGTSNLTLLHCTAAYPAQARDLNLACIRPMRDRYGLPVGASLHFNGISMGLMAYVLGAEMIEMHFTLDRSMKGTDHGFSLEPQGLSKLVRDIERAREAMGDGVKRPLEVEADALLKMGKSLYFTKAMPVGQLIMRQDLVAKSPGGGIPPSRIGEVLGRRLGQSVMADDLLTEDVLEPLVSQTSAFEDTGLPVPDAVARGR